MATSHPLLVSARIAGSPETPCVAARPATHGREVWTAALANERDELPVERCVGRNRRELGDELRHAPAATAAHLEVLSDSNDRAESVPLQFERPPLRRSEGDPDRASIGRG